MNVNSNDPVVPLSEAAVHLGVNVRRARSILLRNGVAPVRTSQGIGYRLDEVKDVRKAVR